MVVLSTGGFSRILVDLIHFLVDISVDFSVDVSVRVSVDCLPVGFWPCRRTLLQRYGYLPLFEVRCSADDLHSNRLLIAIVAQ
jgi:hypothetical protein